VLPCESRTVMPGASDGIAGSPFPKVVGFLGVGTINAAVITGLCTGPSPPERVVLSPRNAQRAAALASAFPGRVEVAGSNQEVLDRSEWVVVAVLPHQAAEVLGALTFSPSHFVVSLLAGVSNRELGKIMAPVTEANIVRAVPLPPVKDQEGVTLVHPRHPRVMAMFDLLGIAVGVDEEGKMAKMQTVTAMMGAYYAMLRTFHEWLVGEGVDPRDASTYVGALLYCIAADGKRAGPDGFQALIEEQTPGGFNEQGIRELNEAGVWSEFKATLTSLNARWEGRAKGSEMRPSGMNVSNVVECQTATARAMGAARAAAEQAACDEATALSKGSWAQPATLFASFGLGAILAATTTWVIVSVGRRK